jgi:hypothetical protein
MGAFLAVRLAATVSPAEVWKVAEDSVLAAATSLAGITPSLPTPLNRYIPDDASLQRYYDILQGILSSKGWAINLAAPRPIEFDDVATSDFFDMTEAVDKRLHDSAQ